MKRVLLLALILAATFSFSQVDVKVAGRNQYTVIGRSVPWGPGQPAVNNNFLFYPVTADSTICVYVVNNNPTNAHPFSLNIAQTGDPSVTQFTGNTAKWANVQTNQVFPTTVPAATTLGLYFKSNAAAYVAMQFTGSTALGGAPDTADIFVVQPSNQSSCGITSGAPLPVQGPILQGQTEPTSQQFPVQIGGIQQGGGGNVVAKAVFDSSTQGLIVGAQSLVGDATAGWIQTSLNSGNSGANTSTIMPVVDFGIGNDTANPAPLFYQRVSKKYGLATSNAFAWASTSGATSLPLGTYAAQSDTVNPGAAALLLAVNATNPTAVDPYRAVVACSAACDFTINKSSAAGSTCTVVTPYKTYDSGLGSTATATAQKACTVNPTVQNQIFHFYIAAGTSQIIDLSGYYSTGTNTGGFTTGFSIITGAALTGTATATIEWMEAR